MRILMVEDDKELCVALSICFQAAGYATEFVYTGEDGLQYGLQNAYDLIILDRLLPQTDGLSIVAQLRQHGITTPVLMLTALDGIQDRVQGLDAGADDYLTKPFATDELLARIRAIARRPGALEDGSNLLSCGDLQLDRNNLTLHGPGGICTLSKKELAFFELFFRFAGQTLSREMLLSRIWGAYAPVEDGNLDNYIYFLRRRLAAVNSCVKIITVRGVGYRLEVSP